MEDRGEDRVDICGHLSTYEFPGIWSEISRAIIESMRSRGFKEVSIKRKMSALRGFLAWCLKVLGEIPDPRRVTPQMVYTWSAGDMESPRSQNTRHGLINHVRNVFREASDLRIIAADNPVCRMKSVAKERRERNILTSEELKSLNDWVYRNDDPGRIELRHRVLFELLVSCAPRSADIISLTWSRIDFETSTITIKESKTAKVRTLGMTGALKRALQAWRPECSSEYVMSVYGTKAHRYSLTKSIRSWFKAIGSARVKEGYIGSHLFRHTLATRAFIKTRDLETARELLGHTSLLTTLQYIHLPPAELGTLKEELSEDFRKEEND